MDRILEWEYMKQTIQKSLVLDFNTVADLGEGPVGPPPTYF